ncbi:M20/M25/M40 family metallo-hydrolase [Psychroflexus aestuariivivens]|uniref:M20/M25/M40 family metallo-hydrolase n=1 Tax=Psychroflexus aestuariivivens TaxID=1795040 RepID=UPI000FD93934|nr:M20/M25/M40 family metallo-hydrolase [Psychroflexus aestuariivivens]
MKKTLLTLGFLSLLTLACQQSEKKQDNQQVIAEFTEKKQKFNFSTEKAMNFLASDELNGRDTGSEGINKAAIYIEDAFKSFDVQPLFETYRDSFQIQDIQAYNVVGVLKATNTTDKKPLLIGAHYDHIGFSKPVEGDSIANGANDNATGTVAVLELANYLSQQNLNRDVIFALFSAEEKGLLGSKHLAEKMKSKNMKPMAVFNIEMLGVPMVNKEFEAYLTGYNGSNMADVFNQAYDNIFLGFLPKAQEFQLFKRSDNYPFFETFKIPSQTICTFDFTNFEYYHHVDDEIQHLDLKFFQKLVDQMKPGVMNLINAEDDKLKLNQ